MPRESTTPGLRELALQMIEARNRGDLNAYMSHFAPDAVWQTRYGERLAGTAAIRSFHEEFTGTFEELSSELLEFVDVGGGATFLVVRQGGRPGGSTSELHERVAFAAVVVDGLIESMTTYSDRNAARAAAERFAQGRG